MSLPQPNAAIRAALEPLPAWLKGVAEPTEAPAWDREPA